MDNGFYKDKYFQQLSEEIAELKKDIKELRSEVAALTTKVNYIYAFASGVSCVAAIIVNLLLK